MEWRNLWVKLPVFFLAGLVVMATLALVIYPKEGFDAALGGMKIFWEIVFPALLPFFILSELMLGLGVVHFIGVLLEPFMRPVFNVPGVGAFAMSMGLAAGYPMDAVLTAKFRRNTMCTRIEGERLLAFTNTADPLFMFGAVAVGMFGEPRLGLIIALAHYLSAFSVGVIFRFYGVRGEKTTREEIERKGNILIRALKALHRAKVQDGRPFGKLMGDAIQDSIKTMFLILGFIMLFSVLVRVLTMWGILGLLSPLFDRLLALFGVDPNLTRAVISGLLEIDIGTLAASQAQASLTERVMISGAIIAWSGLSVHGQVASVINGTDIRMGPYVVARLLHAFLAAAYTFLIMAYLPGFPGGLALTVFAPSWAAPSAFPTALPYLARVSYAGWLALGFLGLALVGAVIASLVRFSRRMKKIKVIWF
ncbi:MAG: sporulation integral membrane protein YlbJ [Firmicutes bacterium]|nr:sporulation integral membrane protein YlbJ [Bacillota bacterium]MCL5038701.1 sporulation integral membrane protein YlbJ [Bacillota bacterium]